MTFDPPGLFPHRVLDHYLRGARAGLLPEPRVWTEAVARRELEGSLQALELEVEARRLAAYRAYVGATVSTASPLLRRICGIEGLDLDQLVHGLAPDRPWVPWLFGRGPADPRRRIKGRPVSLHKLTPKEAAALDLRWFAHSGLVLRDRLHDRPFGVRVFDAGLEACVILGGARLRTHGDGGSITIPGELPAIFINGLPGLPSLPLDALIESGILAGAGCVIERVHEPTFLGTEIVFRLEPSPWRFPWARTPDAR